MFLNRLAWIGALTLWAAGIAAPVNAQVLQTGDNTPLPQPVSTNEIELSKSLGWRADLQVWKNFDGTQRTTPTTYKELFPEFVDGDAVTLQGLFKWRKEAIDPQKNAVTEPGYFSPTCGFSGELVLRGGNCNLAFGWYNVIDPKDPTPPAATQIYELIPSNTETYMQCVTQNGQVQAEGTGFCPFGWDRRHPYNPAQVAWTPKAFDSGMIASDPRYQKKYVAFALVGKPNSQCTQTKHSIAAHNTKNTNGQPWITSLIWQSTLDPEAFYIGFEDLAMTPASWRTPPPGQNGTNDGDFNDFVYYISGINCAGGGQSCDSGLQGACSLGRTDCALEGETASCRPIIQPGKEICDNVDNNCNGVVDDGDGLCEAGKVCDKGACVASCSAGEFQCEGGLQCNAAGFCVDAACASLSCPLGQACRRGACVNACDGTACPAGQECQLGRCIDPCAGVTCQAGRVCERGLCLSNCACRGCTGGLVCGADGRCADTKCSAVTCSTGQTCQAGVCKDLCEGVVCPGGGRCISGTCTDPEGGGQNTSGAGGAVIIDPAGTGRGGTGPGTSGAGANFGSEPGGGPRAKSEAGCGCRTVPLRSSTPIGLMLLLTAAFASVRRHRTRRVDFPT